MLGPGCRNAMLNLVKFKLFDRSPHRVGIVPFAHMSLQCQTCRLGLPVQRPERLNRLTEFVQLARRPIRACTPCLICPSRYSAACRRPCSFRKSEASCTHPASLQRGVSRSSRHVRRGCGGRGGADRRAALTRTAKSSGPGAPRSGAKLATMLKHRGLRRWQTEWFTEEQL